ncbi:hypothetical protein WR25_26111 [Diploscapter pachys]|uniref:Protein kinase domain-containing protein n=1 Tax=Diploscapter pachys TaxID=2018661 RepID=A0A2A2J653_9BILA|nr:hypothetical protein WR25_26111 [Diploscapter pachys]
MSEEESGSGSSKESQSSLSIYPEISRSDIQIGRQLGVGTFGSVYYGIWAHSSDGSQKEVALKKVFMLQKEAEILSKIRHKNIIQFHGICKTGTDFYIITEFAPNGSLYDVLHKDKEENLIDFNMILAWATQIARGINYLHYDAVDTIIHRDLKSKNVVIDAKNACKICDFGTSKDLTHSCTAPTWGGTAAWMSPEIITQAEGLTTATDVWSYGVVLWEMLSREVPYKDFTEFRIYSLISQQGVTLTIPDSCPEQLKLLMKNCWKISPKDRIIMKQILSELTQMESNPQIKGECQNFLNKEDWKMEIQKQKKELEFKRKELQLRQEKLEYRERALKHRLRIEAAVYASAKEPPEDVTQWSEHHTAYWIGAIIAKFSTSESAYVDAVKAEIFKHRITGARLLDMTQKDLEYIAIGHRIEVMRAIRKLKEDQNTFMNFPTLEQSHQLHLAVQSVKETAGQIAGSTSIVLVLGMYQRGIGNRNRFKFYVDSDWEDGEGDPTSSHFNSAAFLHSVCFSILNADTGKPLNEPSCCSSTGCFSMEDWLTADENINRVKIIASIHYADNVTQPRNTELSAIVQRFDVPLAILTRRVEIRLRRSNSILTTPGTGSSSSGFHQVISSPQLRGVWKQKANGMRHSLTESEMMHHQSTIQSHHNNHVLFPPLSRNSTDSHHSTHTPSHTHVVSESPTKRERERARTYSESKVSEIIPEEPKEGKASKNPQKVHGGKPKWAWKKQQKPNRPTFH